MNMVKFFMLTLLSTFLGVTTYAGCDIFQTKRMYMQNKSKSNRDDLKECIDQELRQEKLSDEELEKVCKKFLATPGIKNDREAKIKLWDIIDEMRKKRS